MYVMSSGAPTYMPSLSVDICVIRSGHLRPWVAPMALSVQRRSCRFCSTWRPSGVRKAAFFPSGVVIVPPRPYSSAV